MRSIVNRQITPGRRVGQTTAQIATTVGRRTGAAVLPLVCFCLGNFLWAEEVALKDRPHLRRPIAGAWLGESKLLAVANQRSGSISIVNVDKRRVLAEVAVGEQLADVAALPDDGWLLAVDEKRHQLLVLHWEEGELQIVKRIPVSRYPVNIAVAPDGSRCTIASVWSRTITTFEIKWAEGPDPPTLTKLHELALSFAPGRQLYLPDDHHVLVADAFTGQMAVLNVVAQSVVKISTKRIVRIYGMALSTDRGGLYVGHQTAQPMRNSRRRRGKFVDGSAALINSVGEYSIPGLLSGRLTHFVGQREAGPSMGYFKQDLRQMAEIVPASLTVTTKGPYQSLNPAPDERMVRVRRFWDDVVVSYPGRSHKRYSIRLGPVDALTPADRGEALFYDANLSASRWMSCHSCHPNGHTTGQLVDTLGDGTKGTHKRVLTLLGSGTTGKWAWGGEAAALHVQVFNSLQTTMGKKTNPQTVRDITAYVRTLPPPPPLKPATDDPADQAQLARGKELFQDLGCVKCHVPALGYTSDATYDVGLRDEDGRTQFNPPSLRGVSQGYSFFHDGRATKLKDVFVKHGHPHGDVPPEDELADLLRFLSSL